MRQADLGLSPILIREFQRQMRSRYIHVSLMVYLVVVGALAVLLYTTSFLSSTGTAGSNGAVGAAVFYLLVGMQLLLAISIVPAIAASAITQERQNQTLDLLRLTPFGERHVVQAKLAAGLSLVALWLLVTLPLFSLAFMLGGVELQEWAAATGVILISALTYLLIGACISSRTRTTASAVALTYIIVSSMAVGAPLVALLNATTLLGQLSNLSGMSDAVRAALAMLIDVITNLGLGASAISTTVFALSKLSSGTNLWLDVGLSGFAFLLPTPLIFFVAVHLIIGVVCYIFTVQRVNAPEID